MFKATSILVLAGLCAAPLVAQHRYMPSNTPTTGTCNVIPFGTTNTSTTWRNQKYQCLATAADLGSITAGTICSLAFAPCGTGDGNIHFDEIEIVLAQTKLTTLSTTFNTNLSANVMTVLKAKNYDWNVKGGTWNEIGFDKSYNYISAAFGPNLVIQITLKGAHKTGSVGLGFHRDGTHERLYHFGWSTAPNASGSKGKAALKFCVGFQMADLHTYGVGCGGAKLTLGGSAKLGSAFSVMMTGGGATTPYFQTINLTRVVPGPISMGFLGSSSCNLYVLPAFLLAGVTNSSGSATVRFAIPNDRKLLCTRVYTQMFTNLGTSGLKATNYGRILAGN